MDPRKISSRKEQRIKQLVSAKDQILNELSLYENSFYSSGSAQSSKRKGKPNSRQLPRLQDGKSLYSATMPSVEQPANLMFSMPTLGVSSSLKKKGMIKLPIFRLPAPDADLLALTNQLQLNSIESVPSAEPTTSSPTRSPKKSHHKTTTSSSYTASHPIHSFLPCHDKKYVKKTFLVLLQQLSNEDKMVISHLLLLPPNEIDVIISKLQETINQENVDLFASILVAHETLTLFLTAKYFLTNQKFSLSASSFMSKSSSLDNHDMNNNNNGNNNSMAMIKIDALRAASSELDFQAIGLSDNFKNFLLLENVPNMTSQSSMSRDRAFSSHYSNNNSWEGANNHHNNNNHNNHNVPPLNRGSSLPAMEKHPRQSLPPPSSSSQYNLRQHVHSQQQPQFQQQLQQPSLHSVSSFGNFGGEVASIASASSFDRSMLSSTHAAIYLPPPSRLGTAINYNSAPAKPMTRQTATRQDPSKRGMYIPPPSSQQMKRGSGGNSQNLHSASHAGINLPSLHRKSSFSGVSADPSQSSDPNLLSSELLKSLLNVQKHTNLVKRTLENAQNFITMGEYHNNTANPSSLSTNSKAKEVLYILASEKLSKALYKLILFDCKKAFFTWKLFIIQHYRSGMIKSFIRMMNLRNVLLGFNKIVVRLLNKSFQQWVHQVHEMNILLRRQKLLNAIIKIQAFFRQIAAKEKVKVKKHRKKYEKLYDATIRIQSLMRGKRIRWKYLKQQREKEEKQASTLIQTIYRAYLAKKRVYLMKLRKNKNLAAVLIQKILRAKLARMKYKKLSAEKRRRNAAIKIQALMRGFITRKNIATLLVNRSKFDYAVRIQKIIRGYLTRKNLHKRLRQLQEYRELRIRSVVKMQATYRMYRAKVVYRIMLFQRKLELNKHNRAATQINRITRGFLARQLRKQFAQERLGLWISQARVWTETWSEESQSYFYYNNGTGESIWEPEKEGYTRHDGKLVLQSGEIIEDPDAIDENENKDPLASNPFNDLLSSVDQRQQAKQQVEKKKTKKELKKLCIECSERVAIRLCNECGDQFCTKCYKATHMLGARRHHTFKCIGPKDCNECENVLAIRFCVTCDENYCDKCWRKLHSHGKRVFHPYSEISTEGRVDKRIFTMDGDQVIAFFLFAVISFR
jgi:hypothetical protein